jgi:hypothetical protein
LTRPPTFKVTVVDSTDGKYVNLKENYEILYRLVLSLFARDPDDFAVVQSKLDKVAVSYGSMGEGCLQERLMSPNIYNAMMRNEKVSYRILYIIYCVYI